MCTFIGSLNGSCNIIIRFLSNPGLSYTSHPWGNTGIITFFNCFCCCLCMCCYMYLYVLNGSRVFQINLLINTCMESRWVADLRWESDRCPASPGTTASPPSRQSLPPPWTAPCWGPGQWPSRRGWPWGEEKQTQAFRVQVARSCNKIQP